MPTIFHGHRGTGMLRYWIIPATTLLILAPHAAALGTAGGQPRLAVAWNESFQGPGKLQLMSAFPPWQFVGPVRDIDSNATLRFANDVIYVVNPTSGTIDVFDPDGLTLAETYSLGKTCEPRDIAVVDANVAYVTCSNGTHLLRLSLTSGVVTESVDLSLFADPDGIPDLNMMILHEGRMFVQVQRTCPGGAFTPPPMIAVVDVATETLIDVDASTPGTQAIELQGSPPKFKMQVIPETQRLFVSASGDFFDMGGIEMIDLDSLQSLGLVIAEADGQTGADLGAFVLTTPDSGFLTYSTDFLLSSHLKSFSVNGGVDPNPEIFVSLQYFVPTLVLDAASQFMYYPEGTPDLYGVHVFDAWTGERLTEAAIGTTGQPTDMVLLCSDVCGLPPAVPAMSSYGVVVMALLVVTFGTIVLRRLPDTRVPKRLC